VRTGKGRERERERESARAIWDTKREKRGEKEMSERKRGCAGYGEREGEGNTNVFIDATPTLLGCNPVHRAAERLGCGVSGVEARL
jgi:hypothetical protein